MKKLVVGAVVVGGIIALRVAAQRSGHTMSEHCKGMGAKCKDMMASQSGQHGPSSMREHCQEMMAGHAKQGERTETAEQPEQEAPQFAGSGEAVTV